MIPIIIFIFLILIISLFILGFTTNEMFIYAASVLCIIFGLLLLVSGIETISQVTTTTLPSINGSTSVSYETTTYERFNTQVTGGIGLIFILLGIGFVYFEKKGKNDTKTQDGMSGRWL